MDLDKIAQNVSRIMGLEPKEIQIAGKQRTIVNARSLFCYWAVQDLDVSMSSLAVRFGISIPAISKSVVRGRGLVEQEGFSLIES